MVQALEYPYKPKLGAMIMVILFFGACAVGFGLAANSNNKGLIIDYLIRLGPQSATTFYWVSSAISLIFVIGGFMGLGMSLLSDGRLRLSGGEITIPEGLLLKSNTLRIAEITNLGIQTVNLRRGKSQRFLILVCGGKKHRINASSLPSDAAFDELHRAIVQKVRERVHRAVS